MRTLLSIICGGTLALFVVIGVDSPAAAGGLTSNLQAQGPVESGARTCYFACDTWTLYPTLQACTDNCVDPCERVCF